MENLNKYVDKKLRELDNVKESFEDLFDIMFDHDNHLFSISQKGLKTIKTSFKDAKTKTIQAANYLKPLLNGNDGDFVCLYMENKPEWIYFFWGILMNNRKVMLLNTRLPESINNSIIKRLNSKYIITDLDLSLDATILNVKDINLDDYSSNKDNFVFEKEIALSTSATSMNAKICIYDASSIFEEIKNTKSILKENSDLKDTYNGELRVLAFLPFYHIFGLIVSYFWFSFFGRTLVFLNDFSSNTILSTIRRNKVTHIFAVPMLYHLITKEIEKEVYYKDEKIKKKFEKGLKLSYKLQKVLPKLGKRIATKLFKDVRCKIFSDSVKFMITGGSYINEKSLYLFNLLGYPLYNGYGMSEISISSVELRKNVKHRIKSSIGKPFDSVEYMIDDDGVLNVRGKSIAKKIIYSDKELTINDNEFYKTNDIASVDEKGYYYITGRLDDVYSTENGERINPDIIEKDITLLSVNRFSVLGIGQDSTNYQTCLIVEIEKSFDDLRLKKIVSEIDRELEKLKKNNHKIDKVYFTYDLIANPNAIKVSRTYLKKKLSSNLVKLIPYGDIESVKEKPIEEIEKSLIDSLKRIYKEITLKDVENIDSHFVYDLEISSLEYISLLVKLKIEYSMDFNLQDRSLYTIREIAKYILEKERK